MNVMPEKIALDEACEFLECSAGELQAMLHRGQLPGLKLGKAWVIPRVAFFAEVNSMAVRDAVSRRAASSSEPRSNTSLVQVTAAPVEADPIALGDETSAGSEKDQLVEEYSHEGMTVHIYRNAGRNSPPSFFAVVINPNVANPTGSVLSCQGGLVELKEAAEARAERKAVLLARKVERERPALGRASR